MNHWPFVIGAYAVVALVILVEVFAVRARLRAARRDAGSAGAVHAGPAATARLTR